MEIEPSTGPTRAPARSPQRKPADTMSPLEQVVLESSAPVRLPLIGLLAIPIAYGLFVTLAQAVVGIDYERIGSTAANLFFAVIIPVGVGGMILALVTSLLGWWPEVLRDERHIRPWLAALPAGMALVALLFIDYFAMPSLGAAYLVAATVATLLVGFSEELLVRGVLLTGLRRLTSERWAWFWSSLTFGLLHVMTALAGRALPLSLLQAAAAFFLGTLLYLARRGSGGILVPMLLHALWDFALFTEVGAQADNLPLNTVGIMLGALVIVGLFIATAVAMVLIWTGREGPRAARVAR
jgi:membrane protease YdiL (CAAX protease family)